LSPNNKGIISNDVKKTCLPPVFEKVAQITTMERL